MKGSAILSPMKIRSEKEHILKMRPLDQENYQAKFKLLLWTEEQTHQRILREKYVNITHL